VERAVHRALDAYYVAYEWWSHELVPRVMTQDWSWRHSAQSYLDIYRSML